MTRFGRGRKRRFGLALSLLGLVWLQLNVLCNPFSPAVLLRLFDRPEPTAAAVDGPRVEASNDRASESDDNGEGAFLRPADIDEIVALPPKKRLTPRPLVAVGLACNGLAIAPAPCGRSEIGRHAPAPTTPRDRPYRLRC